MIELGQSLSIYTQPQADAKFARLDQVPSSVGKPKDYVLATLGNGTNRWVPPPAVKHETVRSDVSGGYSYMGKADPGIAESSPGWKITRIDLADPDNLAYATGAWTDRLSLSYS